MVRVLGRFPWFLGVYISFSTEFIKVFSKVSISHCIIWNSGKYERKQIVLRVNFIFKYNYKNYIITLPNKIKKNKKADLYLFL